MLFRSLWNGNREPWRNLFKWDDPYENILLWSWRTHGTIRTRYERAIEDATFSHLTFVRLRTRRAIVEFLDSVA